MFEFRVGERHHTSNWGKFYIKGLEQWAVAEDGDLTTRDKHRNFTYYAADVPVGSVFTVFEQTGDKHGASEFNFYICQATAETDPALVGRIENLYTQCFVGGFFRIITQASGKIKAARLMNWWIDQRPKDRDLLIHAEHCAKYIEKRGVKNLPPLDPAPAIEPEADRQQLLIDLRPHFPALSDQEITTMALRLLVTVAEQDAVLAAGLTIQEINKSC